MRSAIALGLCFLISCFFAFFIPVSAKAGCREVSCSTSFSACSESNLKHPILGKCTFKNYTCTNDGSTTVQIQICTERRGCSWSDLDPGTRSLRQLDRVSVDTAGDFQNQFRCRGR